MTGAVFVVCIFVEQRFSLFTAYNVSQSFRVYMKLVFSQSVSDSTVFSSPVFGLHIHSCWTLMAHFP